MSHEYWIRRNDRTTGPFTTGQVRQMASAGMLAKDDLISGDKVHFKPAGKVSGLLRDSDPAPPPAQPKPATPPPAGPQPSGARQFRCRHCGNAFWAAKYSASGLPRYKTSFFTGAEKTKCPACGARLTFPMTAGRLCLYILVGGASLVYLIHDVAGGAPIGFIRPIIVGIILVSVIRDLIMRDRVDEVAPVLPPMSEPSSTPPESDSPSQALKIPGEGPVEGSPAPTGVVNHNPPPEKTGSFGRGFVVLVLLVGMTITVMWTISHLLFNDSPRAEDYRPSPQTSGSPDPKPTRVDGLSQTPMATSERAETTASLSGKPAAVGGDSTPEEMNHRGDMYQLGQGVPQDFAEAARWYRKAAEAGDANGMFNLGLMYFNGRGIDQDYVEAAKWIRKAADAGDVNGMSNLAWMYENGRGVAQDNVEAVKWYRKAAEAGNARGMSNLGSMYAEGRGVAQNFAEAVKWFRKAAEAGDARGMSKLGSMYESGLGTTQDNTEAVRWYRRAAEKGDAAAMFLLGLMYVEGRGVAQNDAEAVRWFRKAADLGNEFAIKRLKELGK